MCTTDVVYTHFHFYYHNYNGVSLNIYSLSNELCQYINFHFIRRFSKQLLINGEIAERFLLINWNKLMENGIRFETRHSGGFLTFDARNLRLLDHPPPTEFVWFC